LRQMPKQPKGGIGPQSQEEQYAVPPNSV